MSDYVRSQPLSLIQLIIPQSASHEFLARLGLLGIVQFRDLNAKVSLSKRKYAGAVNLLQGVIKKAERLLRYVDDEGFFVDKSNAGAISPNPKPSSLALAGDIDEAIQNIIDSDTRIHSLSKTIDSLKQQYSRLCQTKEVYEHVESFLSSSKKTPPTRLNKKEPNNSLSEKSPFMQEEAGGRESLFIAGTISDKRFDVLNRLLLRALRGNLFISKFPLSKSANPDGSDAPLCGFFSVSLGRESSSKIQALARSLKANVVGVEQDPSRRNDTLNDILAQIDDVYTLLYESQQTRRHELSKIGDYIGDNIYFLKVELELYVNMNRFTTEERGSNFQIAEAWVATVDLHRIDRLIHELSHDVFPILTVLDKRNITPPSKFPRNSLFDQFLMLTHSYGVSTYGEINPSVFMISTFPFLFAVMFGDLGHGVLLLVLSSILFAMQHPSFSRIFAARSKAGMLRTFVDARYLLLLLAIHSMLAGIIYNDAFSRSFFLAPSAFNIDSETTVHRRPNYVYPIGIDPMWSLAANKLILSNSYKMKQSIVLGIVHMLFGLSLSALNCFASNDVSSFVFEFIPRLLFFACTFGYLGFLIIYKWIVPVDVSLISVFINMILGLGKVASDQPVMFVGQQAMQRVFLSVAIVSIPVMLFGKTAHKQVRKRWLQSRGYAEATADDGKLDMADTEGQESLSDELLHSLIHSIEYILGSVSNTASYLRLWALSLAHAQLSEVLWDMVLEPGLSHPLRLMFAMPFWFLFTLGILVLMEGMSAFLHALRLHWVEFNNKFYKGEGEGFVAFDLSPKALQQHD